MVTVERFTKSGWVFESNATPEDAKCFLKLNPWGFRIRDKGVTVQ